MCLYLINWPIPIYVLQYVTWCRLIQCSPLISYLSEQWNFFQYKSSCLIYKFLLITHFETSHRHSIKVFVVWVYSAQRSIAMYMLIFFPFCDLHSVIKYKWLAFSKLPVLPTVSTDYCDFALQSNLVSKVLC